MKKILIALLSILFLGNSANAQFLDQFEKMLDKLTGNESEETITLPEGRSYGANPGLQVICQKAGVKGDTAYLFLTFQAGKDSVDNVVIDSSDPASSVRLNLPDVADQDVAFVVSPVYKQLGKSKVSETDKEMINIATPIARLNVPAEEMVDVMVVYYNFPKKVKKIDRVDLQMKQCQPGMPEKYFGFTLDNLRLKRTK